MSALVADSLQAVADASMGVSVLEQEPPQKKSLTPRAMGVNSPCKTSLVCSMWLISNLAEYARATRSLSTVDGELMTEQSNRSPKDQLYERMGNGGYLQQDEQGGAHWSVRALWKPLPIMGESLWAGTWITL